MGKEVKITVLSENTSEKENLTAEYGLSIGSNGRHQYPVHTAAGAFATNADKPV